VQLYRLNGVLATNCVLRILFQFVLIKLRIIIPNHNTTYVDAAYCYRGLSVCLSVCQCVTLVSLTKTAEAIEIPFGWGLGWAQGTMCQTGSRPPIGMGQFRGERGEPL